MVADGAKIENNLVMAASTLEAPSAPHGSWQEEPNRDQIDTTVDIVTPENIAFNYRVAGPFRRFPAFLIDMAIRLIVFAILGFVFFLIFIFTRSTIVISILSAVWLVGWFVSNWFYGGLFETYMNGQTPGKWLLGIRVLTFEGQPVNMLQAVMRNVLRVADSLPPLLANVFQPITTIEPFASMPGDHTIPPVPVLGIMTMVTGLVVMAMNHRYQRLGDLVCGTMVVIEERSWLMGVARLEDPRAAQLAAYLPGNYVVSRSLAKTLATYVERRQFFSLNRRREIARHLAEPLLARFGLPGDTSHDLLLCALYYRTFVADRASDETPAGPSPFKQPSGPQPQELQFGQIQIRT